ncbi:MAG: polysaccharide biosynthesis tyrosine autokinase [Candidatus Azobacteroides sp.]|nr:polysaccharide biosynthesis tyrosine autokinase [Candidatus Azobacteroides sp.]
MESNNFQQENTDQDEISIVEILFHYLRYWKSFLISIAICLGLALAYLFYATPQYKILSRVVINDEKKGQTTDVMSAFSDLGIITPTSNLDNEIEVLRARILMKGVVDSLRIGVDYYKKGGIKKHEIYKKTPVYVSVPNVIAPGSFTVNLVSENVLSVHSGDENFDQKVEIGKELNSPWGILTFTLNPFGEESFPIEVVIKDPAAPTFLPQVDINAVNKTSSVVELSLTTATPQKGQDIINALVAHYNKNAVDDKNYVAYSTISFIDDRLQSVTGELQSAEKNVESYQKTQGITDLQAQGQLLLTSSGEYNKKITDAGIQMDLLKQIQNYLMNPANKDNAIPSNVGLTDPTVISLIQKYNEQLIEKKRTTAGMSESHPMLIEFNNQIAMIREDLLRGISISEAGIQSTIRELQRQENMYIGQARSLTTQERESRDLFRQQSLKEALFTYLLQKREETGLTLVMATPNAKVIDPAFYDSTPVKPKKLIILLAALMLSVIIPVIIIYIRDLFDNKVHIKEDVTKVISAPFLGVIPMVKNTDPFPVLKIRSSIAERFRTVISNLEFIVGSERRKVISVTSYTSGDGKSFFSRNLAMTLAATGKKTLLIDLDLRKSVMAKTLGTLHSEKGTSMFLSDPKVRINEIIDASHTFHKNLDIIPVQVFPPNPAELLSSERLEQLFQTIGREYDYIVVDTAPIGLVADVYNINAYALSTIFLLRSDYTLKKTLSEIQELYKEKKLNNLSVVLNAVTDENIYGYGQYGHYKHNYYTDEN